MTPSHYSALPRPLQALVDDPGALPRALTADELALIEVAIEHGRHHPWHGCLFWRRVDARRPEWRLDLIRQRLEIVAWRPPGSCTELRGYVRGAERGTSSTCTTKRRYGQLTRI